MQTHKVIMDVDNALGMFGDVDDGLAIALALASPEIELLGCTTCGGNCRAPESTVNTLRLLEIAGRGDIPVAEGRHRPLIQDVSASFELIEQRRAELMPIYWTNVPPLPQPTLRPSALKAHEFIIETVKKHPGEVTIVKEGALTNLALALLVEPEIAPLVKAVVHMGGSVGYPCWAADPGSPGYTAWRYVLRMNTEFDPDATEIVVRSGIPFTFVTDTVTLRVILSQADLDRIEAVGTPYHQFLATVVSPWLDYNAHDPERYDHFAAGDQKRDGIYMHDELTLAVVIDPTLCNFVDMHCDLERFRNWEYPYLYPGPDAPQVRVAVDVDAPRFERFFVDRLSGLSE